MNKIILSKEQYLQSGSHAGIYKVGDLAIKCLHKHSYSEQATSSEFEIQQQLFEAGIKVAQPFEILEAQLDGRVVKAISMEFLEGKNTYILNLEGRLREGYDCLKLDELYANEIQKAENLGFRPYDASLANAIYSKERGLFLIDFQFWKFLK